jgi:hypothetical protein
MQAYSGPLLLPVEVLREHLLPFITGGELPRLDLACRGSQVRELISSVIRNLVVHNKRRVLLSAESAKWSLEKQCFFTKLYMEGPLGEVVMDANFGEVLYCCKELVIRFSDRHMEQTLFDGDFERVVQHCSQLKSLSATIYYIQSSTYVPSIAQHCAGLLELNLLCLGPVYDHDVAQLAQGCPLLRKFALADCTEITNTAVRALVTGCPHLTDLSLERVNLDGSALRIIADHCKDLHCLAFYPAQPITDGAVVHLARQCTNLSTLYLNYAPHLTNVSVEALMQHCPGLTRVDLLDCPNITGSAVTALAAHCAQLKVSAPGVVPSE